MVGYSGTPLVKKLGVKEGSIVCPIDAPDDYLTILGSLPSGVRFVAAPGPVIDIAHVFAVDRHVLERALRRLRRVLRPDAAVWVSWPKRTAKVATTVTEDVIREVALPLGFVDIKVCAVTQVWSGLKLTVRKELR